jgi:hypothetical protein
MDEAPPRSASSEKGGEATRQSVPTCVSLAPTIEPPPRPSLHDIFLGRFDRRRTLNRLIGVLGILFYVVTWRLDQAVRTAHSSGWTGRVVGGCTNCRLPRHAWVDAHVVFGIAAGLLLTLAVIFSSPLFRTDSTESVESDSRDDLRTLSVVCALIIAGCVGVGVYFRLGADGTASGSKLTYAATSDILVLVILGSLAMCGAAASGGGPLVGRVRRFVQRHRVNLIAVVALALALTVVSQTSGQAIDSVRTWVVGTPSAFARMGFGLVTALLLSLVVYESSVRLTYIESEADLFAASGSKAVKHTIKRWWWFSLGGLVVVLGVAVGHFAPAGYGLTVPGILLIILGALDIPDLGDPNQPPLIGAAAKSELTPEYLALIPLLSISVITIAAAIDAELSDAPKFNWQSLLPLVPGLILAAFAVIMNANGNPRLPSIPLFKRRCLRLPFARRKIRLRLLAPGWLAASLGVGSIATILLVARSPLAAAIVAFVALGLGAVYAWFLFHGEEDLLLRGSRFLIALPLSACAGLALVVGVHVNPQGVGKTFGVFGLINIALAAMLTVLHYAVAWSLEHRPPRLLWSLGVLQLPILTLLVLWWIGAGLMLPHSLHDVRVAKRSAVERLNAKELADAPTIKDAFEQWLHDQGSNTEGSASSDPQAPIPLVLVAAHGGGIRAAYWTALALDCVTASKDAMQTTTQTYDEACQSNRRDDRDQQQAGGHIFLASGVSGGAVGLYAYVREKLSSDALKKDWVAKRLGGDFASPTIGWGLFHDLPNHLIGLSSERGGACGWRPYRRCLTADRTAILEDSFDQAWVGTGGPPPYVRASWDARTSSDNNERRRARSAPIIVDNSTATGGKTRAVTSAVALSNWPHEETDDLDPKTPYDLRPLAGTLQTVSVLCHDNDLRLSTAAILAGRFPYVSAAGELNGHCYPNREGSSADVCMKKHTDCSMDLVDGGYTDNSGLFTVDVIAPLLQRLIVQHNVRAKRPVALVIIEIDNHYRARPQEPPIARSGTGESLVPLVTSFGGRSALETFARSDAYRLTPDGCTVAVSPALHPGVMAPLGWELSETAISDLKGSLVRPRLNGTKDQNQPLAILRRLQKWLGGKGDDAFVKLSRCIPSRGRLGRPGQLPPDVRTRIRRLRSRGWSYRRIADKLNDERVPTAQGGTAWYAATVRKVAQPHR